MANVGAANLSCAFYSPFSFGSASLQGAGILVPLVQVVILTEKTPSWLREDCSCPVVPQVGG